MSLVRKHLFALPLLLTIGLASVALAGGSPGDGSAAPRLVSASDSAVILELKLPDVQLGRQQVGEETFDVVAMDGWGTTTQPGWPQLPVRGVLLAAPTGGQPELRLLQADAEVWPNVRPLPVPAQTVRASDGDPSADSGQALVAEPEFVVDPRAYTAEAAYPGQPVEIGFLGKVRDQHVVQVLFQPFQYQAARRELRVYRTLRVEVHFSPGIASIRPAASTPFDRLLAQSLLNYDTARAVEAAEPAPLALFPSQGEGWGGGQPPALKVIVNADGVYRVTGDDLAKAGLDLAAVDPRRLQLSHLGTPVPVRVTGTDGGRLDPGDAIEFYGVAMTGPYTDRNVYWLSLADGPGARMTQRDGAPRPGLPVPGAFTDTLHLEENHLYWDNLSTGEGLPDGAGKDHWFWDRIVAGEVHTYTFTIDDPAETDGQAAVGVSLRGRTDVPDVTPDHHTRVYLNGRLVSDATWDGKVEVRYTGQIPQVDLQPGSNTLVIQSVGDTGASVDSVFLDWFEIDYARRYVAEQDRLSFTAPGPGEFNFQVVGFSQPEVELYDITDPYRPVRILGKNSLCEAENKPVFSEKTGFYQASADCFAAQFSDRADQASRYFAVADPSKLKPAALILDEPSSLRSPDNQADYILITHRDFLSAAQRLAEHRRQRGLQVAVVDVTDVYDEFSGGIFDPRAIRDFLAYAYQNWARPAPTYVLLLGDASYDYKDYLGTGRINYVPVYLVETPGFGPAPSDNWYADVSGDDTLPDLFIGRLSVATPQDADTVVDKIIHYEPQPAIGDWNRRAVFVTDDQVEFDLASDSLARLLPPDVSPVRIYTRMYNLPQDPMTDVITAVNRGALIVNYVGHGNVGLWGSWAGGRIFETASINRLNNGRRLPLLTVVNCLNGFFAHPEMPYSLAEEWVRAPDRGGIAAWAPSGLGYLWPETALMTEFYRALFTASDQPLGAASAQAETVALGNGSITPDVVQTFVLLGDPALRVAVPRPLTQLFFPVVRR
jgi:hypothetical protein